MRRTGYKVKVTPMGFCSALLKTNKKEKRETAPKTEADWQEKLLFCFLLGFIKFVRMPFSDRV